MCWAVAVGWRRSKVDRRGEQKALRTTGSPLNQANRELSSAKRPASFDMTVTGNQNHYQRSNNSLSDKTMPVIRPLASRKLPSLASHVIRESSIHNCVLHVEISIIYCTHPPLPTSQPMTKLSFIPKRSAPGSLHGTYYCMVSRIRSSMVTVIGALTSPVPIRPPAY